VEPAEVRLMFAVEKEHWWFAGKRLAIKTLLAGLPLDPGGWVLDLGCGTGALVQELSEQYQALGLDYDPICLGLACRRGGGPFIRGTAARLPLGSQSISLLVAADVLYHRQVEVGAALKEFHRVLKPGGWLLILDSAYQGLMGRHDAAVHGARRFARGGLCLRLQKAGFTVHRATYRNTVLAPLLIAARLYARFFPGREEDGASLRSDVGLPPAWLNGFLLAIMRLEARWLKRHNLAFGTTVCALARKD